MTDEPTAPRDEPDERNEPDGRDLDDRLRELVVRTSWLEIDAARRRDELLDEVRTRRVVVVDDDGRERIVLATHERFVHVTVSGAASSDRDSIAVELFANDAGNGDGAEVGVALIDDGDVVATLNVFEGQPAVLWLEPERPEPE